MLTEACIFYVSRGYYKTKSEYIYYTFNVLFQMGAYMAFPVSMFYIFNQPEIHDWMIKDDVSNNNHTSSCEDLITEGQIFGFCVSFYITSGGYISL